MCSNNPHYLPWNNYEFSKGHEKTLVGKVCKKSSTMVYENSVLLSEDHKFPSATSFFQ